MKKLKLPLHSVPAVVIQEYHECISGLLPVSPAAKMSPCAEGGAAFGTVHPQGLSTKQFMLFYSPESSFIDEPDPQLDFLLREGIGHFADVLGACMLQPRPIPFDLKNFAECILDRYIPLEGYSSLRGMAFMPWVPEGHDFPTCAFVNPMGGIFVEPLKATLPLQPNQALYPELEHVEVILLVGDSLQRVAMGS